MILDEVKEAYVKDLILKGKRADGRGPMDYRPIRVEKNVFSNCEGSAIAYVGDTKVLAGVKIDVAEPFSDRPNEGIFMVNSEFTPAAHPDFEPGPPNEKSIELARVVDRGIRAANSLDLASLVLPDGKVLGVFIDVYVLDHSGNLTDAAALAAMAALNNTRLPKYEPSAKEGAKGTLVREEAAGGLAVKSNVVTCSFEKINGTTVVDATDEEEIASDGRLTIALADGQYMVAGQKSGRAGFKQEELLSLFDAATAKYGELAAFTR
ncbi:MAG: exosome complex protein Rrp42 [Candidatus Micrarchaeota archaeon]